jgi:hypothetical protein
LREWLLPSPSKVGEGFLECLKNLVLVLFPARTDDFLDDGDGQSVLFMPISNEHHLVHQHMRQVLQLTELVLLERMCL